ncbi:MAG: hypothetical protein LC105_05490 [Chitinophagales bacterium]|nr:hypothetical protein [Chitinophagales bacterium]
MEHNQYKPSSKELFYVPLTPASEEVIIDPKTALKRKDFLKLLGKSKKVKKKAIKSKQPK